MKKLFLIVVLALSYMGLSAQSVDDWFPNRTKVNFKDSTNFAKTPLINGVDTAATLRDVRAGSIDMSLVRVEIGDSINALRPFIIYVVDTANMLAPYVREAEVTAITDLKLNVADTTNMLSKYIRIADTLDMLDPYLLEIDAADTYAPLASPTFTGTVTLPTNTSIGDVSSTEIGYVNGVTSAIQTQLTARQYFTYDYYIEESGGTVYARPSPNTSLPAYSNANLTPVLQNAIDELTSGGKIFIDAGIYDECDSIVIANDNITIEGAGKYKTILKLKANFDVGKTVSKGFIQVSHKDNFKISNLALYGNGANQDKIDDGVGDMDAICDAINSDHSDNLTIENCYIYDWTRFGIHSHLQSNITIRNSHFKDCYWNGITFGWATRDHTVDNCLIEGSGDVAIALYGFNHKITNCTIKDIIGTKGSGNTMCGISFEYGGYRPQGHVISNNTIHGAGMSSGILSNPVGGGSLNTIITGNWIDSADICISMYGDSALIQGNQLIKPVTRGVEINQGDHNVAMGNTVHTRAGQIGIYIVTSSGNYADNNIIASNTIYTTTAYEYPIGVQAGNSNNVIINNIFIGDNATGNQMDIYDLGTNTVMRNNYNVNLQRWSPETGKKSMLYTATDDGLTTGIIFAGSQFATVTSADASYICCLPSASASTIGTKIEGRVGANGFKLRVAAAQAGTVYLNGVTTDVGAAIPANSNFEVTQIDATHWILKAWDALGVPIAYDEDSYNVLNIDSIVRVGNTFQIFDGNTQLDPDFTDAGSTDLGIWAKMQADTVPIFVFGLGSGQSGDTAVFNDNAIAGAFWHNESDTLVVTSLMGVLAEGTGTETIAVQVSWGDNFKDGTPTNLNTSAYTITSITSGDEYTAFDNAEIPPNKWVWCTISGTSAGNRPSMLVLTLSGYYKNQSW